jgi:SAM-dependent methyltransferase
MSRIVDVRSFVTASNWLTEYAESPRREGRDQPCDSAISIVSQMSRSSYKSPGSDSSSFNERSVAILPAGSVSKAEDTDIYRGDRDTFAPERRILSIAFAHVPARAVHVFASLGIADILEAGPKSAAELAKSIDADASALHRLLRFLSTIEIVEEADDGRFSVKPLGRTLRAQQRNTAIRDNVLLMGSQPYWWSLGGMPEQIKSGENAFRQICGTSFFDYLASKPEVATLFYKTMDSISRTTVPAIATSYDFSGFSRIVDVAGGRGALLIAILKRAPSVQGVLFDLPNVISSIDVDPSLVKRLETVPGNFLEVLPPNGDCYLLNRVLHNWDDATVVQILRRCRKAIKPHGRLLIIEMSPPEKKNGGNNWAALDMLMMLLLNGRERDQADFQALLSAADFALCRVVDTKSAFCIIEALPT